MYLRPERRRSPWILITVLLAGAMAAWAVASRSGGDPDEIWREAEAALRADQLDRAEAAGSRLSRLREPTPLDWMLRAQVATGRGRHDEAVAALARVPDDYQGAAQA